MMYLVPEGHDVLVMMFAEHDIPCMREGRTRTIEPHQLAGRKFNHVVVSLHKDHDEIKKILTDGGYDLTKVDTHVTIADAARTNVEVQCGCGIKCLPDRLFEGKCIICWSATAKRLAKIVEDAGYSPA